MSDQLVTKFKFFWDDADHALERWLEEMARQGLHLQHVGCTRCKFVFKRGEPADMTYRLDFRIRRPSPYYVQLFTDAGWEHVDQSFGWQFWRVRSRAGRSTEIFTDPDSRIKKYQRLLWLFAFAWSPFFLLLPFEQERERLGTPLKIGLMLAATGLSLYAVARLLRRIRQLRNPMP